MVPAVRAAVLGRIGDDARGLAAAGGYIEQQWRFMERHGPRHLAQLRGIADGYGLEVWNLFVYLHMGMIEDADGLPAAEEDGCSAVAVSGDGGETLLAKNRDYRGEHKALQRVFLDSDPAWGERHVLSVGSLGSPGAFSSGINSDGLALVDTRVGWRRPRVGWLRYLLMNEILVSAGDVAEALEIIERVPHAGGGVVALADSTGARAVVELGAGRIAVQQAGAVGIARTNHFHDAELAAGQTRVPADPASENSVGRFQRLQAWLDSLGGRPVSIETLGATMAGHAAAGAPAVCRHGGDDRSETISSAVFACNSRKLYFCPGNPCRGPWQVYAF
jgi:isopenicillin-N N-acyltransferase-like protein